MRFEGFSALLCGPENSSRFSSIPMFMIEDLISERGRTQEEAINEVSEKWSLAQTITGPYLNIQYPVTTENNGEKKVSIKDLFLFPDELLVNGQLKTEILKRSIYEVNVYQSDSLILIS